MITDLVQIKKLGEQKLKENEMFRRHLKRHNFQDLKFRRVAEAVEDQIDCRSCANCCKVAETNLQKRDVEKLAKFFGISPQKFIQQYTTASAMEEDEDEVVLRRRETGCIFLDGNDCSVYEARPDTCRNFPHLVRGKGSIESRMWQFIDRATYCPIVYNTLEEFKQVVGFQK